MLKGWEVKQLDELCSYINDGTHQTPKYVKEGIPFYSVENVTNDNFKNCKYISEKEHCNLKRRCNPEKNDILMTRIGSIGECKLIDWDINASIYVSLALLKTNNLIRSDFLAHYINSKQFKEEALRLSLPNATPQKINTQNIRKIKIIYPSDINEQIDIANSLTDINLYIKNLEGLLKKKKLIKQGVMQELLTGKKRLPGFDKEWVKKELGELGEFTGGGVDKKSIPGQKKVTLLNFLDVYHRDFIYRKELYHNVTASDAQIRKCTLKKGDLFFTPSSELRTDLALSAVVMEDCPGCVYSYHITRFRFKDEFDLKFKSYMFNNKSFLDQAALAAEGSGKRYVVNLSKFKTLTITYPTDIKEQAAIATILWDVDQEINSLEQDLEKYKQIKQGMMEQLLTGKIRLVKESDNVQTLPEKKHNQHFDDAVVFANIVASCYDPGYPLGRKKCQKMMYLFKRFNECSVDQFKHYAAGPYDNKARYGGFETIAIKNKYVVENKSSKGSSFAPGPEIEKAKAYCSKYGYDEFIPIFNQYLKYKKVDELELYTTVDKTILELKDQGSPINLNTVKTYISNDKTWVPKLSKEVFNDENIEEAIRFSQLVLGV